jgi:hypothetical protein
MNKSKALVVLLIVVLTFPAISSFTQNSQSNDEGKNQSVFVSAARQPNVTITIQRGGDRFATNVTVIVVNHEQVEVSGVASATVSGSRIESQTKSSDKTTLLAYETRWIYFNFKGIPYGADLACFGSFKADSIAAPAKTSTPRPSSSGGGSSGGGSSGSGSYSTPIDSASSFRFDSVTLAALIVIVIAFCLVGGFIMVRRGGGGGGGSEQRIRKMTSYEYQEWVIQKMGARAASVLDTRKGIDAFTNDNTPLMIQQTDSVGRYSVDSFMNALTKARARNGVIVAFGFDFEAKEAAERARMNRVDIRLMTVRELINLGDNAAF